MLSERNRALVASRCGVSDWPHHISPALLNWLLDAARAEGGAGRCGTCHHFTPERDGFGSCARWAQGYGSQGLAPNEVRVENDEGWGMIMGADFGCVLYLPAESGASGTDGAELPPCQPERPDHDR